MLDLCCGSGVLALTAAGEGAGLVTAVDASLRAVLATRLNARLNGLRVRALRGDLFAPLGWERFDLIVSNPPYVPAGRDGPGHRSARAYDGGREGRAVIEHVCAGLPGHLHPGGVALIVHSSVCGGEPTLAALRAGGLDAEVVERRRGPLGPLMRARAPELRRRGLLPAGGEEEDLLVIRGRAG